MNTLDDCRTTWLRLLALFCLCIYSGLVAAQPTARSLFNDKESLVYQVRVIDLASGDKYSIGSGFRISESGYLATNFHVVSSFVHDPDKYRLEYIAADSSTGDLTLLAIDVVHDLAIVDVGSSKGETLALATADLSKGDRIYSMGNPQDLGMTIIEGTYNGFVENSRYRKILFSGSLNAGMSGGPALNAAGEVIGINVAKGGEQLSFLVPVQHLAQLVQRFEQGTTQEDFAATIRAALLADQDEFYQALLDAPLQDKQMGKLLIPGKLHESLKCWGHTVDEDESKYEGVHQHCKSEDQIFVSGNLYVGSFNYDVELISTEELNRFQFYSLLEGRFAHPSFWNTQNMDEVTDYECHDGLVNLESGSWKVSTCLRAYKKYDDLYDATMIMVSTDYAAYAAIVKVGGSGVSAENATAVFKRIMEAVSWRR